MEYENNTNRREQLLSRFRESLQSPMSERDFDASELVEIFDYAGDVGDDYLRIEALMCAARYYSDNEELLERKAIFYSQFSDDASHKYIDDNPASAGMVWDILRSKQEAPDSEDERLDILNGLLNKYDVFNDEEVIQLVDLASSYGQLQWLKDNMPVLRTKVEFLNILLYEVAVAADMNQDSRYSAQMLEELTELEPFNTYFWTMLAKIYATLDETEKALSAIDYALAISPDDTQSIFVKAKLLYTSEGASENVIGLLKSVLKIKPDIIEVVRFLSSVYYEKGENIMAAITLRNFLDKFPDEAINIIPDMVIYRPKDLRELLDRFYQSNKDNSEFIWASWAHHLSEGGYPDIAQEVLDAYQRNSNNKIYALFPIEHLFMLQQFDQVIENLSEYLDNNENTGHDFLTMVVIHLLSMIKLGEYEKSYAFCLFIEKSTDLSRFSDIASRMQYLGLKKIVSQIKTRLKRTQDPADWADYDPLGIWS